MGVVCGEKKRPMGAGERKGPTGGLPSARAPPATANSPQHNNTNDDDNENENPPRDPNNAPSNETGDVLSSATTTTTTTTSVAKAKPIKLYKSTRLKGYITLVLASFINYDAVQQSGSNNNNSLDDDNTATASLGGGFVPSTPEQRRYAVAVAVVSLALSGFCLVVHLDRVTPLEKVWIALFVDTTNNATTTTITTTQTSNDNSSNTHNNHTHTHNNNGSKKFEGLLAAFLTLWWSIATGFATVVQGMAGDGKGQYSLYYSYWACCLTSFWILERWGVAAGWSSMKSFISSWPNRSPAWICILVLSFLSMIWYLDLSQNHNKLTRPEEFFIHKHFDQIGTGQWQWLIIVAVMTIIPSLVFVLIELFRETKADGSTAAKSPTEVILEGICFLTLILAWTPTVMIVTTPRGAASLIGNSYFTTWLTSIFVFEGFIWFIHDKRNETYYALKEKEEEYRRIQRQVLEQTNAIKRKEEDRDCQIGDESEESKRGRSISEYFDAVDPEPESRLRLEN